MTEVFVTNVATNVQAGQLKALLAKHLPQSVVSFDLDDCDRVLRVEGHTIVSEHITTLLCECGFECRVME